MWESKSPSAVGNGSRAMARRTPPPSRPAAKGDTFPPRAFQAGGEGRMFTHVVCDRKTKKVQSGIRDLVILKSTGSGFENYPKDELTTLPETADRILATSFSSPWTFKEQPADYNRANDAILSAMLKVFANNYSPSAQTTLFQMGEAALAACLEISELY